MAEDYNIDHDEKSFKRQTERLDDDTSHAHRSDAGSESATDYPASLLGDSKLSARGNTSVQTTVMQRMQQSYGNKAVQRFLQRSASGATDQVEEESIASRIQSKSGGGSSLDGGLQRKLESGLGADMSGVRVHTDGEADHMARSVDAVAFTTGSDIFFRSGAYNPESSQGLHLLAHEATHTVQQSQGPVSGTPSAGGVSISDPSDSFEQAAEQSAANVVAGNPASAAQRAVVSSPPPVQREAEQGEAEEEELQTMRSATYASIPAVQREAEQGEAEEEELQTMRSATYASIPAVQREAEQGEAEEEELQTMRSATFDAIRER